MILGLFSELMTAGGIETIGRHTAAVLVSFARERDLACRLLSLNDSPGEHLLTVGDVSFTVNGFGRKKSRFVKAILTLALQTRLTYISHPRIAPLGLLLRLSPRRSRYLVATYGIDVWERLPLLRKLGLNYADTVTALSQFTAEAVVAVQKVNPQKTIVLPPALDPAFFRADEMTCYPNPPIPSGKILLTVARLKASEKYKGVGSVMRALPMVLKIFPNTHYIVVGDGDDRNRLEGLAHESEVRDHVVFAGSKEIDELRSYYNACQVFVMPSRAEGFGVVFLEAMAFGKPVIGGNHGGTPDVVMDGVTGYLVEYGDVAGLTDRILRLLSDEELCKQMGDAARSRVEENYTFKHFRDRFYRILRGVE